MENWIIFAICAAVMLTLIIIHIIMRSAHPIRSSLLSLLPGLAALICVDLVSSYTNVMIPISPLSLSISSVLGIPGVTSLLIIQRIL